jgi:hypothetical protein
MGGAQRAILPGTRDRHLEPAAGVAYDRYGKFLKLPTALASYGDRLCLLRNRYLNAASI